MQCICERKNYKLCSSCGCDESCVTTIVYWVELEPNCLFSFDLIFLNCTEERVREKHVYSYFDRSVFSAHMGLSTIELEQHPNVSKSVRNKKKTRQLFSN